MDRRRFEAAHLKYACLQTAICYPEVLSSESKLSFKADIMDTLNEITPVGVLRPPTQVQCIC